MPNIKSHSKFFNRWVLLTLLALLLFVGKQSWSPPAEAQVNTSPFIVQVRAAEHATAVPSAHGIQADAVWEVAVNGFAARLSSSQIRRLKADDRVLLIEPDLEVRTTEHGQRRVHAQLHENPFETLTSGVDRIDADRNPRTDVSSVGIAVIDTGVDLTHPDLNVRNGATFVKGTKNANDDNGHGTHVAGIAAAKTGDNRGVRGVAPNAVVWAVKVLDRNGSGTVSQVISGVNWVTKNAASKGIKVANMSLGFFGTSSTLNTAISNSVAAGVTYVVAAGNSATDAAFFSPANHPDVITVSAMGDSDGKCGAAGPPTSDGPDDTFATFSNFGSLVEIAAPGVDITSTYKGGVYATLSGTSMASPHVAGAAAQYIASHPGATPSDVRSALIASGIPQAQPCPGDGSGAGGFTGDSDGFAEPLVYAATL